MAYIDYPITCIAADSYRENPERGSTLHRAEDGTPWVVNLWPETRYTFEIVHPALSAEEQLELEQFYDQHIGDEVRWFNPRRQNWWRVRMVGPPRLSGMRSGLLGDVEMTLVGEMVDAPTNPVPPVVSGLHQIGQVISVSQGTWQSEYPMQFEYQWLRNGEPIAGATDQNYTLVDDDLFNMISVRVTASSFGGSTSVETDPVRARLDSAVSWLYSDMAETIFVDTSGNTPATWGDPVGLIKDSSGNGNDFTQPTVTARPILGRVPRTGRTNLIRNDSENVYLSATARVGLITIGETPNLATDIIGGVSGAVQHRLDFSNLQLPEGPQFVEIYAEPLGWEFISIRVGSYFIIFSLNTGEVFRTSPLEGATGFSEHVGGGVWKLSVLIDSGPQDPVVRINTTPTGAWEAEGDGVSGCKVHRIQVSPGVYPYQRVTNEYDITEAGVKGIHYLRFDGTDDQVTTTLPAISGGTIVLAGVNGIWIDDDFSFGGGTFSIGPTSYTNGPDGILTAIGEPIVGGFLVINRQLSQLERERVIQELKERGAPGVLEPGPEISTPYDSGRWIPIGSSPGQWSVVGPNEAGVDNTGGTTSSYLRDNEFGMVSGRTYLLEFEVLTSNGVGGVRLTNGTDNTTPLILTTGPASFIFRAGGVNPGMFGTQAFSNWVGSVSSISVKELELTP